MADEVIAPSRAIEPLEMHQETDASLAPRTFAVEAGPVENTVTAGVRSALSVEPIVEVARLLPPSWAFVGLRSRERPVNQNDRIGQCCHRYTAWDQASGR